MGERIAGSEADGPRLFVGGMGGEYGEALCRIGNQWLERGSGGSPAGGGFGQRQRLAHRQRAGGPRLRRQLGDRLRRRAERPQQLAQAVLRVAVRCAGFVQQRRVGGGAQRIVEPGQDDDSARQCGKRLQQPRRRRDRAGGAGGDHRAIGEDQRRRLGLALEPEVAQLRGILLAQGEQLLGPGLEGDVEELQRLLPVGGEIGLGDIVMQPAEVALLDGEVVGDLAQRIRQPQDFRGIGRGGENLLAAGGAGPGVDQLRQEQLALQRGSGGRQVGQVVRRQERLLVLLFAAEGPDIRQKSMISLEKRLRKSEPGAAGGEDDGDVRKPERPLLRPAAQQRAVEHAIGQHLQKRRVRRNGEQFLNAHERSMSSASASAAGSPTWNQRASRATPSSRPSSRLRSMRA